MRDAIVIGCGIIGATVSSALRERGDDVLCLDDGRPLAGTPASGGHIKVSWLGGMPEVEYLPALRVLDEVWGLKEETYKTPKGTEQMYRVDTEQVVECPRTIGKAIRVDHLGDYPVVEMSGGAERCRLLVIATGAWSHQLLPEIITTAKQGVSFYMLGRVSPLIYPWAPYKQVVAHQQDHRRFWVGDGSAIIPKNWGDTESKSLKRCLEVVGEHKVVETRMGLRPYAKHGDTVPCLLTQLGPRAWVATGAGKLGTIAAGWVVHRVLKTKS